MLCGRKFNGFKAVRDPAILARLDETASGHVVEIDLRESVRMV